MSAGQAWDQRLLLPHEVEIGPLNESQAAVMNVRLPSLELQALHYMEGPHTHHLKVSFSYSRGERHSVVRAFSHEMFDLLRERSPALIGHALWVIKAEWGHITFVISPTPSYSTLWISGLDSETPMLVLPR